MNEMMLIVDDDEMSREILKTLFAKQYDVMEAENGSEALMVLQGCQGSIDVVLLDLMMEGITGFDILEKRKNMDFFSKIPVIVITSSGQLEDQIRAFDLGANEYICKPFMPEIVRSRVNNVMASNRRMLAVEIEAQRMKIKSELDEMTGVFNKTTTELAIDEILKNGNNNLQVLMVIDIDNFKAVNDTSGHQVGDHVIKIVANLISGLFRKTDIVGRIGGDEFCVLMVDVPNMEVVYSKVNELIQTMRYKPNLTIPEYVTLSIGFAVNEPIDVCYKDMFRKADEALYEAKKAGKAQYKEYGVTKPEMPEDERAVAILFSNSRNVCSSIQAFIPNYIKLIEVLKLEDMDSITDNDKEKTMIMYVDVSDYSDDASELWSKIKEIEWIDFNNVFAVCEEGNVSQYMTALKNGVTDMFTTPIDQGAFKRRTARHMEKMGIKQIHPEE